MSWLIWYGCMTEESESRRSFLTGRNGSTLTRLNAGLTRIIARESYAKLERQVRMRFTDARDNVRYWAEVTKALATAGVDLIRAVALAELEF